MFADIMIETLTKIRAEKPLIHQITNMVTMNDCANTTLAIGASPIMARHAMELEEIIAKADSLVLNMGTLDEISYDLLQNALLHAKVHQKKVLFDPVGVGASQLRRELAKKILNSGVVRIIRGNEGEIRSLGCHSFSMKGIDYNAKGNDRIERAKEVARHYQAIVAMTGEIDVVTDGTRVVRLHNGVAWLPRLTGTGCMTSSLVGTFLAFAMPMDASVAGISYMSLAGEIAWERLREQDGLGTFRMYLHDALSNMSEKIIKERLRISYE